MSTPLPRSEFAVTRRYVYLNHASAGPLPLSSAAAIEAFVREHAEEGVLGTFPHDCRMPEYRDRIGRFIGAAGSAIALLPNTSAAAGAIASGIEWNAGDEVVVFSNEFPANTIPWIALRRRGVNVRMLETVYERLTPAVLQRVVTPRTRLVAVSWVSYADGYRHDLKQLAAVAHEAGAFFCVDAMQGLGAFPLDVAEMDVDAAYAGAAKWMLGLHGIAVLFLGARLRERLRVAMPGWRSVENMWDFHNYEQPLSREAMSFEAGTPNLIGTISVINAVELFERSGKDAIACHILALTDRLCEGLHDLGAEILSERGHETSSGIVTFKLAEGDPMALGRALESEGILTTYRTTGIRVSPHGYNTATEIDQLLDALRRIPSKKVLV